MQTYKLSTWFAPILFSGPSWVHSILHHWQTFYVTTGSQFHFYADDTQLYISFSTNSDLELTNTISKIEECLTDLDKWMPLNILQPIRIKLNFSLYFLPYSKCNSQQCPPPLRFGTDTAISIHQKLLCHSWLYHNYMPPHVNSVFISALYHLRNVFRIRKFLATKTSEITVRAFVSSKFNHRDPLLYNVPIYVTKKLQSVQNVVFP